MSDTKQRLEGLDRLEAPDVWDRALRMEPAGDLEDPSRSVGRRVVVIVVAFALFIAAGSFAWRALRPPPAAGPAGPTGSISPIGSIGATVLWPERTAAAVAASQAAVDSGDASASWRTDPTAVASRFAEDVLRWGKPDGVYLVTISGALSSRSVDAHLTHFSIPCAAPLSSSQVACPPPFVDETLTLTQPARTGFGGIWSVKEVRADGLDMALAAGTQVPNGTSISGQVTLPDTASAVPGFSVVSGETIGYGPGCGETGGGQINAGAGTVASVQAFPEDIVDCGTSADGYVWIATESGAPDESAVVADPLQVTPSYLRFYGLTMVPMRVLFEVKALPTTAASSATSTASVELVAPGGLPIAVDYPADWVAHTSPEGDGSTTAPPPPGGSISLTLSNPSSSVTIKVEEVIAPSPPTLGSPVVLPAPEPLPLSGLPMQNFLLLGGVIKVSSGDTVMTLTFSSTSAATPEELNEAAAVLASIRPGL